MLRRLLQLIIFTGLSLPLTAQVQLPTALPAHGDRGTLRLWVANDMLYVPKRTDQYYTAGLGGEVTRFTPDGRWRTYGLRQDIFTPKEIAATELLTDDRPFAGILVGEFGWGHAGEDGTFRKTQRVTLGVLGKYAGAGKVQNSFHKIVSYADEVPGWVNEINPDLILNYQLGLDKDWSPGPGWTTATYGRLNAGTLNTNLNAGIRLGPVFQQPSRRVAFSVTVAQEVRAVAYNATLTGGFLNRDMRYRNIVTPRRIVAQTVFGARLRYRSVAAEVQVVRISPEFLGGSPHTYAVAGVQFYW